jgi:serine/threonine-protein kinase
VIEVTAPGYEPWTTPIKVEGGGGSANVRVPGLIKAPETQTPKPVETPVVVRQPEPRGAAKPAAQHGLSTQQALGLFTGAVGLVGVGIGSYFGVRAIGHNSDADPHCPKTGLCEDSTGVDLTKKARHEATGANIAFAAGGVLLATGAVLYLTGGHSDADRVALVPALTPELAAATVRGRF